METELYILERRSVELEIAGSRHAVGTLRFLGRAGGLPEGSQAQIEAACALASPKAVLVAPPVSMVLACDPCVRVAAHLVLGWDQGRGIVTGKEGEANWDRLPVLGYAVWLDGRFVLHAPCEGRLIPVSRIRAAIFGILAGETLLPNGQARILQCEAVRRDADGRARADCLLSDGSRKTLNLGFGEWALPKPEACIGKRPMDLVRLPYLV